MIIAVAADHAGYPLKEMVIATIKAAGHEVLDLGVFDTKPVDYPDYAAKVAGAIQNKEAERGILLCGSGVGACITANKFKGVYAGVCHDTYSAHQGVEHDDMNVICLGGRIIGSELVREIIMAFLKAEFTTDERHVRRVNKVRAFERQQ
ncbi:MAG: ribose 5-phosphate isomerase B [Anaerolineaceae bacterium]|nr:ribose 5-phosphate isomerase B [Anaerolineaceae bacterium]MBN2678340.1 ribose 5-phosphate isomerase B [Anaerolineaceae bacterium]